MHAPQTCSDKGIINQGLLEVSAWVREAWKDGLRLQARQDSRPRLRRAEAEAHETAQLGNDPNILLVLDASSKRRTQDFGLHFSLKQPPTLLMSHLTRLPGECLCPSAYLKNPQRTCSMPVLTVTGLGPERTLAKLPDQCRSCKLPL